MPRDEFINLKGKVVKISHDVFLWQFRSGGTLIQRWLEVRQLENPKSIKKDLPLIRLNTAYAIREKVDV